MKEIEVTICNNSYNEFEPLTITNYEQQLRIFLLFNKTNKQYTKS